MVIEHGHFRWVPAQDSSECLNPEDLLQCQSLRDTTRSVTTLLNVTHVGCISRFNGEFDDQDATMKVEMVKPSKRTKPHMPRNTFISKSQAKKKAKADSVLLDLSIEENEAMMQVSEMLARNAVVNALRLTAPCREDSVNMGQGWRREEEGLVRVRRAMDNGCGVTHYRFRKVASWSGIRVCQ